MASAGLAPGLLAPVRLRPAGGRIAVRMGMNKSRYGGVPRVLCALTSILVWGISGESWIGNGAFLKTLSVKHTGSIHLLEISLDRLGVGGMALGIGVGKVWSLQHFDSAATAVRVSQREWSPQHLYS